jgi:MarR family transcriptional regulator, organic hydroperoxide resistance regulator
MQMEYYLFRRLNIRKINKGGIDVREDEIKNSVSFLLIDIAKLHRHRISVEFSKLGIYVGQDMILRLLWKEEGLTQSQIINRLQVEPPTITKMMQRMEKAGLLKRKRDLEDGRVSRVFLTDKGRRLQKSVTQIWNDLEECLLQDVSEEERILIMNLLARLKHNLS